MAKNKELSFEEKFEQFQEIVDSLESSDLPMETLIEKFETGMKYANELRDYLAKAELKIIDITKKYNTGE